MQIWQYTIHILLRIISSLFVKKNNLIIENYSTETNEKKLPEITSLSNKEYSTFRAIEKDKKDLILSQDLIGVWESLIDCFESLFKKTEIVFKYDSTNAFNQESIEELIKSCQEMNIIIISFIVNSLIPNSFIIPKNMQEKLINLLDSGCNFDCNLNDSQVNSSSFSRVCISNLFELCKFKNEDSIRKGKFIIYFEIEDISNIDEYIKIKTKLSKIATPILIKKCRDILKKFIDDENKSGVIPMTRARIEDVKFVLDKLKTHEIHSRLPENDDPEIIINMDINSNNYFQNAVTASRKSHLFNLIRIFSDFVTTKDNEIRLIIKEIFKIISNEIGTQIKN